MAWCGKKAAENYGKVRQLVFHPRTVFHKILTPQLGTFPVMEGCTERRYSKLNQC